MFSATDRSSTGLSRAQVRKQIEAGKRIHRDDQFIRQIFKKYAVQAKEEDKFAHIPKARLLVALQALDVEIQSGKVDDFFQRHDQNGDNFFDLDEFKQAILAPHQLPHYKDIRKAFESHSVKNNGQNENLPDAYIPCEQVLNTLKSLSLKSKTLEKTHAYLVQGALSEGGIGFEEFNQAILSISPLQDEQGDVRVFEENAVPGKYFYIPADALRQALLDLGLVVTDEQLDHFRRTVNLNFNGCIKYNAFKHMVLLPSPMEDIGSVGGDASTCPTACRRVAEAFRLRSSSRPQLAYAARGELGC